MSSTAPKEKKSKVTVLDFLEMKKRNEKITMLTAYDYPMAKSIDMAGADSILVGDSLGMVIYGLPTTLPVEVEDTLRCTQAVARGAERAMVIADLPFMSYALPDDAVRNSGKMLKYGNAAAVKLEGGREREKMIKSIVENGIPVMGHIGLTPTYVNQFGGMKVQGKTAIAAEHLLEDAKILEEAGVFSIVLETIPWKLAQEITKRLRVPTIGIGAGPYCDGQVLVSYDMLGISDPVYFKFIKKYANIRDTIISGSQEYCKEVKAGTFPTTQHSFEIADAEFEEFQKRINIKK